MVIKMDLLRELALLKDPGGMFIVKHHLNVYYYSRVIARAMAPGMTDIVETAAMWHDIGKIGMIEDILGKPGKLTDEEWLVMKTHPTLGAELVRKFAASVNGGCGLNKQEMDEVVLVILCHHERWDGNGYPNGLKSEEIPLAARIIAVADAYDAMTAGRPYKAAVSRKEALTEIMSCAGSQFDPGVAEIFVKLLEEGEANGRKNEESEENEVKKIVALQGK